MLNKGIPKEKRINLFYDVKSMRASSERKRAGQLKIHQTHHIVDLHTWTLGQ